MKKNIVLLIFGLIIFFLFSVSTYAATIISGTVNSSDGLNLRKGAGTSYTKVATVPNGYSLSLQSTTKYNKSSACTKGWYKVTYKNATAYACSNYVANVTLIDTTKVYNNVDWSARINGTDVSFRQTASSSATLIAKLNYGTNLSIISKGTSGNGCSTNWYRAQYLNNVGYVCGTYIFQKNNIINNATTYNQTWASSGFPASYYPYLTYLKAKYPKATFTAVKTNTNFYDAVLSESGSNYIQTKDTNLVTSTKMVETGGWYNAKNETIAFYLDPRNFLNEKTIFIFEDNKYTSDGHTSNVVKSVFSSGSLSTYSASFVSSGSSVNLSPVHLATRVRQEVGINGNKATVGPYYNFFNIGAYSSCSDPLLCGLTYAKNSGWDTPVKSITAGANLLKSNYYNNNQKTRYYEKFNVINGKYSNQYMTNINAPVAESTTAYENYIKNNVTNSSWNFIIPVFNNMPSVTSLPASTTSSVAVQPVTQTISNVSGLDAYLNTYNSITIKWNKVSGASGYKIWYRKSGTSSWDTFTTSSNKTTKYNLTPGYSYYFKVKAYNNDIYSSSYSNEDYATTMTKSKIRSLSKKGRNSIKIKYANIPGETGYRIYRKTKNTNWVRLTTRKKSLSRSWTNTGRKKGTRYYYRVRAYKTINGKKIFAPYSDIVSIKR